MLVDSRQPAERWLLYSGNYQPALTAILKQHTPPGGCCLDVGANLGFYTIQFGDWVGSAGRVVAFEANPALVDRVEHNVRLNGFAHVSVVSAAVYDQPGEMAFFISSSPGKSSTHLIDHAVKQLTVPAITLDGYLSEHPLPRLDVIKMDIEGSDCHALLGAVDTLTRFRPLVVFEYKPTTPPEVTAGALRLLERLDYRLLSLSRNGEQRPFDRQTTTDTDVLCVPPAQ
jgi:FkbM family methyltransferase